MDINVIITGIIGIIASIVSGFTSYFFTRRKYNVEVNSNEIENLKNSLDFYEKIVQDNNRKLQFYIELVETNRLEIYRLKEIIHILLNNICLDKSCLKREFYSKEQLKEILGETLHIKDDKYGTET